MMNVFSNFSDEAATWTVASQWRLFHPHVSDGISTNQGVLVEIQFLYRPWLFCVSMNILGIHVFWYLIFWAASLALFEHISAKALQAVGAVARAFVVSSWQEARNQTSSFPTSIPTNDS